MFTVGTFALVTGASTGIGREIAMALAREGIEVGLIARSVEGLQETKGLILNAGGKAESFPTDLRNLQSIEELWASLSQLHPAVDILANVAGVWHSNSTVYYGPDLAQTPAEQIDEVLDVGIRAPMHLTRLVLSRMIKQKSGKVLNISGTFESGASGWLHYYVSKKAIEDFTVGLAQEVRKHRIQVNCISPSDTLTPAYRRFFPDFKEDDVLDPGEISRLAVFLVSEAADNITGQIIEIRNKNAS